MIENSIIETIVKIGNDPEVIKICEPQVCFPQTLQRWMVKRVLESQELLWQKGKDGLRRTRGYKEGLARGITEYREKLQHQENID